MMGKLFTGDLEATDSDTIQTKILRDTTATYVDK